MTFSAFVKETTMSNLSWKSDIGAVNVDAETCVEMFREMNEF